MSGHTQDPTAPYLTRGGEGGGDGPTGWKQIPYIKAIEGIVGKNPDNYKDGALAMLQASRESLGFCLVASLAWIAGRAAGSGRASGGAARIKPFKGDKFVVRLAELDGLYKKFCSANSGLKQSERQLKGMQLIAEEMGIPGKMVAEVCRFEGYNGAAIMARTLPMHVGFVLFLYWDNALHAVALYHTQNNSYIFDPNIGEMRCGKQEFDAMFEAFSGRQKAVAGQLPAVYSLYAITFERTPKSDREHLEYLLPS